MAEPRLFTMCSRGLLAEWDPATSELLGVNELDVGEGKVRMCTISATQIITYQSEAKEFKMFDINSKQLIRQFPQTESKFTVSNIAATDGDSKMFAYTQGKNLTVVDLSQGAA